MKYHTFDGTYHILLFQILTSLVKQVDTLDMSEAQTFVVLPTVLANPAETQFQTNLNGGSRQSGVTCWLESI